MMYDNFKNVDDYFVAMDMIIILYLIPLHA
jgi:hypothetical protein